MGRRVVSAAGFRVAFGVVFVFELSLRRLKDHTKKGGCHARASID
jgi:hypothetical protein